ncbi:MAG TPA: rhomboid family intramembrane serine protease, partial [Gemmatimonadaceae bacterium]|nr:rhomboid family intramembrane serine protease [Gemmatimonadaceae bacterium]
MLPIGDENPTLRTPVITYLILGVLFAVWLFVQGGAGIVTGQGSDALVASVCNYGMVPGELTGQAPLGFELRITRDLACVVDDQAINWLTPVTSMFLHGSWGHILSNSLYLWVFGNNVEDSMGRGRFVVFYLLCGLAAAGAHVLVAPASPVPTVGASGAISGILGAYLVLYPHARVRIFWFIFITHMPAWLVLVLWFGTQVITGLPQLMPIDRDVS